MSTTPTNNLFLHVCIELATAAAAANVKVNM